MSMCGRIGFETTCHLNQVARLWDSNHSPATSTKNYLPPTKKTPRFSLVITTPTSSQQTYEVQTVNSILLMKKKQPQRDWMTCSRTHKQFQQKPGFQMEAA